MAEANMTLAAVYKIFRKRFPLLLGMMSTLNKL
jgi:hypothetical protein